MLCPDGNRTTQAEANIKKQNRLSKFAELIRGRREHRLVRRIFFPPFACAEFGDANALRGVPFWVLSLSVAATQGCFLEISQTEHSFVLVALLGAF